MTCTLIKKKPVFSKVLNGKNLGNASYYVNIAVCTVYNYATSTQISKGELRHSKLRLEKERSRIPKGIHSHILKIH